MKKIKILKTLLISTIGITTIGTITAVSTSCSSPVVIVTGVSLNKESLPLGIGESDTLIATVLPENVTDKSVNWTSSDSSVANVDNNGKVTAVSEGQTTITVTTNDGGKTATCQVTVYQEIIHVTSVSLNKNSLILDEGGSETLTATVLPENATDKSVTWSSSNNNVATVDNNGKVTAVKEGQAAITVITNDGGFTATCQVTVNQKIIHVMGVLLNKESLALGIDGSETLTATVLPEDATDKSVTWSSSDSSVATVDNNGKVTAVSEGSAKITVTTNDGGFTATCQVTVYQKIIHVIGVLSNKKSLTIGIGGSETLTATVLPENAADKSVTWSSSNNNVATVDNNGKVTAVSKGSAKITVTTNDGGFTDTCQVTVRQSTHAAGVSLDKESLTLEVGDSDTLTAIVHPEDTTDKSVTWSSSDPSVAIVYNNGTVRAVGEGRATITVKTNDGGYKDDCDVTVLQYGSNYLCVTAGNADSTLELRNEGGNNPNLQYSVDLKNWRNYSGTIIIPANSMYFLKGNNPTGWSQSDQTYSHFNTIGNISISGSIMSLLDNGTGTISSIPNDYCFYGLFHHSIGIRSVSENFLPATTLTKNCYNNMFIGCLSLTTAPAIQATTLADYCCSGMFANCASLTTVPDLPATTVPKYSYNNMFLNCLSLLKAPAILATTLGEYSCASMFINCKSLTVVPDLLATNLGDYCCECMFEGSNIQATPALPATKLAASCYRCMFRHCEILKIVPDLPATELAPYCYYDMFAYTHHLESIRIGYKGTAYDAPKGAFSGEDTTYGWVNEVALDGWFYYSGSDTSPIADFKFQKDHWQLGPY